MNHLRWLKECFLTEASFARGLPSDEDDRKKLFANDNPSEFVFVGNGGYAFWDNGSYIDICVHISPGNWVTVDNEQQYETVPNEIKDEYVKSTGSHWPAPGGSLKRIVTGMGMNPHIPPKKSGPAN